MSPNRLNLFATQPLEETAVFDTNLTRVCEQQLQAMLQSYSYQHSS